MWTGDWKPNMGLGDWTPNIHAEGDMMTVCKGMNDSLMEEVNFFHLTPDITGEM